MKVDHKKVQIILRIVGNPTVRNMLQTLGKNEPLRHSDIKKLSKTSNYGMSTHFIQKMVKVGIIKKEMHHYYLTRLGLESVKLINKFEKRCLTFDLSDCDAEGHVQVIVERPKDRAN